MQNPTVAPGQPPRPGRNFPAAFPWGIFAAILLSAWSLLAFPEELLTQNPDASWSGALVYAHEHGWEFGRDIVFTYGPLGWLSISFFAPSIAGARMIFEIVFGFGIATGLCLLVWRMTVPWRCALLGYLLLVATPLHLGGDALYSDLGLFAWGLLCFLESGRRLRFCLLALVAVATVASLVKFTFLVMSGFTILAVAINLASRAERALAFGTVVLFALSFCASWVFLGQNFFGIGAFLRHSYEIASGYNDAMAMYPHHETPILLMILTALLTVVIRVVSLPNSRIPLSQRGQLLVWLAGLLFLSWKYGCVRTDYYHVKTLFGLTPIIAICLEALPAVERRALLAGRLAMLLCLFAGVIIIRGQIHRYYFPLTCVKQAGRNLARTFAIVSQPAKYLGEKTAAFHVEEKKAQLPKIRAAIGAGSTDVFGQNQMRALFNGLNYRPRPVFQSYSAYNRQTAGLNERFYLSSQAPEYVLFNLEPIDNRLPALEDSTLLRNLFIDYQPLFTEGDYLLLQHKSTASPQMTLVAEGTVASGENIDLQNQPKTNLWLEVELRPTFWGRLERFLYKPPELTITSRSGETVPEKFHASASMLAAGFIASPLLLNNRDFLNLCQNRQGVFPKGYSITNAPGFFNSWQPQIHYRLYRIEN